LNLNNITVNFFDIFQASPNKRDVLQKNKDPKPIRYMLMTLMEICQLFIQKNPSMKVGKSKFCSLKPRWIKTTTPHDVCVDMSGTSDFWSRSRRKKKFWSRSRSPAKKSLRSWSRSHQKQILGPAGIGTGTTLLISMYALIPNYSYLTILFIFSVLYRIALSNIIKILLSC
jgi:hypothetical protein